MLEADPAGSLHACKAVMQGLDQSGRKKGARHKRSSLEWFHHGPQHGSSNTKVVHWKMTEDQHPLGNADRLTCMREGG